MIITNCICPTKNGSIVFPINPDTLPSASPSTILLLSIPKSYTGIPSYNQVIILNSAY